MNAGLEELAIMVEAADTGALNETKQVIESHLVRFAFRENLQQLAWRDEASFSTRSMLMKWPKSVLALRCSQMDQNGWAIATCKAQNQNKSCSNSPGKVVRTCSMLTATVMLSSSTS